MKYTDKDLNRFWSKVSITNDPNQCWLWTASSNKKGYGHVWWDGNIQQSHRVAWKVTFGEIPNDLLVLHNCDNPPCCNPYHLFLGTNQENSDDKNSKNRGRWFSGEENTNHKLSDAQVYEIRRRYAAGENSSYNQLSKDFGVNKSHIWRIVSKTNRKK